MYRSTNNQLVGHVGYIDVTDSFFNLDVAGAGGCFSFLSGPNPEKIVGILFRSDNMGTQALRKCTGYFYDDNAGRPGNLLNTSTELTDFATGMTKVICDYTPPANSKIWVWLKNTAAAPGTQAIYPYFGYGLYYQYLPNTAGESFYQITANDGAAWTNRQYAGGIMLELASGQYVGVPFYATENGAAFYGAVYDGFRMTVPSYVKCSIEGVMLEITKISTPIGNLSARVWVNGAEIAPTVEILPPATYTVGTLVSLYFSDPVAIAQGDVIDVLYTYSVNDAANAYRITKRFIKLDNAAVQGLTRWGMHRLYSTDSGATRTADLTKTMRNGGLIVNYLRTADSAIFPANGQTLRVADGGPATWGYDEENGPGTAVEESAARNTITDEFVTDGHPYIRLGVNAIGSAPAGGGGSKGIFSIGM